MWGKITVLALALLPMTAFATFIPEGNIRYDKLRSGASNITEDQFNSLIKDMQTTFAPIVKFEGGNLNIVSNWTDNTANSQASQSGSTWRIDVYGGLARRPEINVDGMKLVICHELGHHLGGFSFGPAGLFGLGKTWAANEGEADYFATQVCGRYIWAQELTQNAQFRDTVLPVAKAECDKAWSKTDDQNLCYRVATGGQMLANTLAALEAKPAPKFETPDSTVVSKTNNDHPETQCRLDTYFHGSICPIAFNLNLIPGKKTAAGPKSLDAEKEAAAVSCTAFSQQMMGLRPNCWYKPRM